MTLNHEAIYKAYPNVVTIDDGTGAFDADGNQVQLDQATVDAAAAELAAKAAAIAYQRQRAPEYPRSATWLTLFIGHQKVTKANSPPITQPARLLKLSIPNRR